MPAASSPVSGLEHTLLDSIPAFSAGAAFTFLESLAGGPVMLSQVYSRTPAPTYPPF